MTKYITVQGDLWDTISLKCYGDEHYIHKLIETNYKYRKIVVFPANIELAIPKIDTKPQIAFPKWRNRGEQ